MKKINSCAKLLPLLLLMLGSCSDVPETPVQIATPNTIAFAKNQTVQPANSANPFDDAGRIHSILLDDYFKADPLPQNIGDIIARVATLSETNTDFMGLTGLPGTTLTVCRANHILQESDKAVPGIFEQAPISGRAKVSLKNFTASLLPLCESGQEYGLIYDYIVDYENLVLADTLLSDRDRQLMLTTTSIARYAASKKKRPKRNADTDWEINIFHVAGSIDGMSQDTPTAITSALSLGIAGNR